MCITGEPIVDTNKYNKYLVFSWVMDTNYTQIVLKKGVTKTECAEALEKAGF